MNLRCIRFQPIFRIADRRAHVVFDANFLSRFSSDVLILGDDDRDDVADATRLFADRDQDRQSFTISPTYRSPGTSAAVITRSTPGIASASDGSIAFTSARG